MISRMIGGASNAASLIVITFVSSHAIPDIGSVSLQVAPHEVPWPESASIPDIVGSVPTDCQVRRAVALPDNDVRARYDDFRKGGPAGY